MRYQQKLTGIWSSIGTWLCLLAVGSALAPAGVLMNEFIAFLTGGMAGIPRGQLPLADKLAPILFIVAVQLPIAFGIGYGVRALIGKADTDVFGLRDLEGKAIFKGLFMAVLLEELYARWLFLGVLTKVFTGPGGFYAMLLIGNLTWALAHLWNYKNKEQRNPLRVLSQFVSGLFFSFVYLKYGLLASVVAHFAFNAVIFASHKVQNTNAIDGILIVLNGVYAGIAYVVMDKPLSDIGVWFDGSGTFAIPGWTFGDYLVVAVFLNSCFALAFDLLLYDKNVAGDKVWRSPREIILQLPGLMLIMVPILALFLAIVYAVYFVTGLFVNDVPVTILVASILLAFLVKSPSCSAAMRTFWTSLPSSYVFICVVNALGFMGSLGYLCVGILIAVPQLVLSRMDD